MEIHIGSDPEDEPCDNPKLDDPWRCFATKYGLTRREIEAIPLFAQRLTDREISERLGISHRTVMNHSSNILGKLGLGKRTQLIAFLKQHGLVIPSDQIAED